MPKQLNNEERQFITELASKPKGTPYDHENPVLKDWVKRRGLKSLQQTVAHIRSGKAKWPNKMKKTEKEGEEGFKCDICSKTYGTEESLRHHKYKKHPKKQRESNGTMALLKPVNFCPRCGHYVNDAPSCMRCTLDMQPFKVGMNL